ncbi:MAG: sugar lactone lactonase YvrE [Candidatus Binatia bacterium]|jgi:sugar lactone lactonase YvrE
MAELEELINLNCILGENPLWNANDSCIYWEDIEGRKVHRLDPTTGQHVVLYDESKVEDGQKVGGFTFQANGDLLLFRERDFALLKPHGDVEVVKKSVGEVARCMEGGLERFNDVIADPLGRVLAGSIGVDATKGGLYLVDLDGSVTPLWQGTQISNGMGFAPPDWGTFYWTDSTQSTIFSFPFNVETGEIGGRPYHDDGRVNDDYVFYRAPKVEGTTDGMTIDKDGNIWSARWDGNAIVKIDPSGEKVEDATIAIPVRNVTSLCFGGAELDQFYITTARLDHDEQEISLARDVDGSLYRIAAGTSGPAEFQSRILID